MTKRDKRTRPMMDREAVAVEVLRCALAWEPDVCLLGNVMASELAALAASAIDTCPDCGATAWANIDCDLCTVVTLREMAWFSPGCLKPFTTPMTKGPQQ